MCLVYTDSKDAAVTDLFGLHLEGDCERGKDRVDRIRRGEGLDCRALGAVAYHAEERDARVGGALERQRVGLEPRAGGLFIVEDVEALTVRLHPPVHVLERRFMIIRSTGFAHPFRVVRHVAVLVLASVLHLLHPRFLVVRSFVGSRAGNLQAADKLSLILIRIQPAATRGDEVRVNFLVLPSAMSLICS